MPDFTEVLADPETGGFIRKDDLERRNAERTAAPMRSNHNDADPVTGQPLKGTGFVNIHTLQNQLRMGEITEDEYNQTILGATEGQTDHRTTGREDQHRKETWVSSDPHKSADEMFEEGRIKVYEDAVEQMNSTFEVLEEQLLLFVGRRIPDAMIDGLLGQYQDMLPAAMRVGIDVNSEWMVDMRDSVHSIASRCKNHNNALRRR